MTTYDPALGRTAEPIIPHYDRVQRAFHWTMAAVILAAMAIGLYCAYQVPGTPLRKFLLEWHKSLGMTALVLAVLRVGWRAAHAAPAYVEAARPPEPCGCVGWASPALWPDAVHAADRLSHLRRGRQYAAVLLVVSMASARASRQEPAGPVPTCTSSEPGRSTPSRGSSCGRRLASADLPRHGASPHVAATPGRLRHLSSGCGSVPQAVNRSVWFFIPIARRFSVQGGDRCSMTRPLRGGTSRKRPAMQRSRDAANWLRCRRIHQVSLVSS